MIEVKELLRSVGTPYEVPLWSGFDKPLTYDEVTRALDEDLLLDPSGGFGPEEMTRAMHAARVAWFVKHGWDEPIEVNPGAFWPVVDGNHRLAAALYRADAIIEVLYLGPTEWR